jgi:hypothetical protein
LILIGDHEKDNLGRISKFEAENLQLTKREDRLSHSKNTPGKEKVKTMQGIWQVIGLEAHLNLIIWFRNYLMLI